MSSPTCKIDKDILNKDTIHEMKDIGLSFFAAACGKNRGAFVLDPPDGNTYGCLQFPTDIAARSGIEELSEGVVIKDANAIKEQYVGQNITGKEAVALLDFLVQNVYDSSPNKAASPYACEFNGLAVLECKGEKVSTPRSDGEPIRSVTLAGLFVPAPWATNGKILSTEDAEEWYTQKDFQEMKTLGLNTVQISVPTAAFNPSDDYGAEVKRALKNILDEVDSAGLEAILSLVGTGDEMDFVVAAAKFASRHPSVMAVTLPSGTKLDNKIVIDAIRVQAPTLPIFIPVSEGDLVKINAEFDDNVYGSLEMSHTTSVADIASSTSMEDRSKMFYHEATACMVRSPMEFSACFQKMPVFLGSGFDLSIDDCINQNLTMTFRNYGQCDRFSETTDSGWWFRHRQSYAARQLFAAERGMGWSFAAWKLYENADVGTIDRPEKLLSLKDVVAAGLFPDLHDLVPGELACLNPPENDFAMGDATFAPTAGPPPDCGNGWWNFTTSKCDYWVPPPDPTPAPTVPCPACDECPSMAPGVSSSNSDSLKAGGAGALVGAIVVALIMKFCQKNRSEYTQIPN